MYLQDSHSYKLMTNFEPFLINLKPIAMSSNALQWLTLVVIIWLQSVNGTNTTFPTYSPQLKELLSMSQAELNNLSFASDAGKLFGFLSGMAALYLSLWLVC
jgi:hypothetical protein